MAPGWSFKTIESVSDFHRVMPALAELHRAVGAPRSPAAHPQWVRAWWETRPRARRIVCFLGLLDGDLRVFIPLEFGTRRFSGLPVPKAETTNLAWGWTSALIAPDTPGDWVGVFHDWLRHKSPRWAVLEMGAFPSQWSGVRSLELGLSSNPWRTETFSRDMAVVTLPTGMDDLMQQQGRKFRQTASRARRRGAESGLQVHVQWPAAAGAVTETLSKVSQVSWQGRRDYAVATSEALFYKRLASGQDGLTLMLGSVRTDDGRPIGYSLCARVDDVAHGIDTGFDPAAAKSSPGFLAILATLESAVATGVRSFDLGQMADYKTQYHPTVVPGTQIRVVKPTTAAWVRTVRRLRTHP